MSAWCAIRSAGRSSSIHGLTSGSGSETRYFCSEKCRRDYGHSGNTGPQQKHEETQHRNSENTVITEFERGQLGPTSSRSGGGCMSGLHRLERRQISVRSMATLLMTRAASARVHGSGMMASRISRGGSWPGRDPSIRDSDASRGLSATPRHHCGRPWPSTDCDGLRGGRDPARPRPSSEGRDDIGQRAIAEYATPSTRALPERSASMSSSRRHAAANHGALTLGTDLFSAYYKMETIEHFANISFVARMLGGERLLSRDEVVRLQGLRGMYGISSPAPICVDPEQGGAEGQAECQTVFAPSSGRHLVATGQQLGADQEIRLTYGELTALIEEAVRNLK